MADTKLATGANQLRKNSLGVGAVTFLVISATAPLVAFTSFSVVSFFNNDSKGENALATKLLPSLAGVVMAGLFIYIFAKFGDLTGAAGLLGVALPALVIVAAIVGYILASNLANRDLARFKNLGNNR